MADFDSSLSLPNLLCHEDEACCFNDDEDKNPCLVLGSEELEYIEMLIQKESDKLEEPIIRSRRSSSSDCLFFQDCSWLACARSHAIDWILNTRAAFGFQFHTAYLSVTYLDRFLSKRYIDDGKLWAIRLLSVACLSLAAKMEECDVPSLSEYSVEDYCFENRVIQRMELLVLNTLEWKMGSITPFVYLRYFINKICGESGPREMVSKSVELIMAVIKEMSSLDHRPSVIAAAAALAAYNVHLTSKELELKMAVISSGSSQENEHVLSCYIAMQEIEMGKLKTPGLVICSNPSSLRSSLVDDLEHSSFISGAGSKRRLAFDERDQNFSVKKICRQ